MDRNVMPVGYDGRVYDYQNNQEEILKSLSNWFYLAADEIARVVSQAEYEIVKYDKAGNAVPLTESVFFEMIDEPNPSMGRMELWYLTWSAVRTLGNAFWYTPLNTFGKRAEFYFMHPQYGRMCVKKNSRGVVTGYVLERQGLNKTEEFTPQEIIHFRYPSILNSTYGVSPSMHFKEMIDLDLKMKEHANAALDNGLQISKVISSDKMLSTAQEAAVKAQLRDMRGAKKGGGYLTSFGAEIKVAELSQSLKDIDYLQALGLTKKQIYAANGVPIIDQSVNRSVAEVGQYVFMLKTITPDLRMFADFLNRNIFWQYDNTVSLRFKNVIPDDDLVEAQVKEIEIRTGQITLNEARGEEGREPYLAGDEPLMMRNVATLEQITSGDNLKSQNPQGATGQDTQDMPNKGK